MKLPPYTLVRRSGVGARKPSKAVEQELISAVRKINPALAKRMQSLNPQFRRSLLASAAGTSPVAEIASKTSIKMLERSVREVRRAPRVDRVGLWDVSSQVGRLPDIIAAMNAAQPTFAFFEVQAAVPVGLISRPERVVEWASELTGTVRRTQKEEFRSNVIFEDFSARGELVRKGLGIEYLVGIVPSMVASEDKKNIYWNSFSVEGGRVILVSTYDLNIYATRAGRPFEMAVASVVISSLLASINAKVEFHSETRGCLFDENKKRATIVESLAKPKIEPGCLNLIRPKYRDAAEALVKRLATYRRSDQ